MSKRIIAIVLAYCTQLAIFGENTWYVIPFYLGLIQVFNKTMVFE